MSGFTSLPLAIVLAIICLSLLFWSAWPLMKQIRFQRPIKLPSGHTTSRPQAIISDEPEISIQIDNCSFGNLTRIDNEDMRLIEVALTLCVKNPPVNVTDLQLYIEDGMQKLVDSNPPIPFTQKKTKGCYIVRFGYSLSRPNFVISNEVKKYQIHVMANRRWIESGEFSPKNFIRLLAGDREGSQT